MSGRRAAMDANAAQERAKHARGQLAMAELAFDDSGIDGAENVAGSAAMLAGIAAADAICGYVLGERSSGQDHREATELLAQAVGKHSRAPSHLRRLLAAKTETQYTPLSIGATKARGLLSSARALAEEMETVLRGTPR